VATVMFIKTAKFTLSIDNGVTQTEFQGDAADVHVEVEAGDTVEYPTLDGNVAANSEAESYSLVMRAGQDYSSTGLARFMWDNARAVADIELNAFGKTAVAGADTPSVTGQVTLSPVTYGGEVSTFAEFEITLPFVAKPVLSTGAAAREDEGERVEATPVDA
jgi:hypothetical protein